MRETRIEVPEEIVVMGILAKLPVKSLMRFRCVCKPWCSSFQTPDFISKHHHNNLKSNNLNLLLTRCNEDDTDCFSSLSTDHKGQNFSVKENIHLPFSEPEVSGTCNGLLCLHDCRGLFTCEHKCDDAAIWNPSTREFKLLPKSSVQRPPYVNSTTFGRLGFGFDSKTDDYKVVRFVTNYSRKGRIRNHQVEVFSLKSDSWKEISVPEVIPCNNNTPAFNFNTYINGFYYWDSSHFRILSFDMANEKFSTLPLPQFGGSLAEYSLELLDFNGSLGAIVYPKISSTKFFDLWVMNGSWARKLSIDPIPRIERPLGFWKNGELFLEGWDRELVLYDPATGKRKNLGIHRYRLTWKPWKLIAYIESLVPINGIQVHDPSAG